MKRIAVLMLAAAGTCMAADPLAMSARVDTHIQAGWKANSVTPAAPADDAEFLRRVYLDLAGRIPRVQEVRDFLADKDPNKRRKIVDQLLDGSGYVQHFSTVWRREWLPQTLGNPQFQFLGVQFEAWMKNQLRNNTTYDKIVREVVTAPPFGAGQDGRPFDPANPPPVAFLQVNELKPENVAASASRLFLGVKIECAQCHDHPFDTYSRKQFWQFATFFAGLQPVNPRIRRAPAEALEIRMLTIPGTEEKVSARYLDGKEPKLDEKTSPRVNLMDWMTAKDNPYFARNAANRMWAYFFGTGLIDPLDEPGDKNPPTHPELLDELAKGFTESGYDLKYLIKAIVNSRTYQQSSAAPAGGSETERTYARMRVRGLTPEQLFDSLAQATYYREQQAGPRQFVNPNSARGEFLARFATTERLNEVQTSILQALTLMNGKLIGELTSADKSELLASVIDAPFLTPEQKIETLYLATVSRLPRPNEMQKLTAYLEKGGAAGKADKALTDIFWALLNSSEFAFNH